jgi:hypothetical protein
MAISVNWDTKVITVPQADLTFISGTLYEMDTDVFRLALKNLEDDVEGMPFLDTHQHNTQVTVAGTTFARTLEIINGYTVQFTPDAQWTVRLVGSNNNIFDVENGILVQNQVQVIPTNSAGLIVGEGGSAPTAAQVADAVWDEAQADHLAAGSTGESLNDAGAAGDPGAIWDEAAASHVAAGTFGALVQKLLTVAKFLGLK